MRAATHRRPGLRPLASPLFSAARGVRVFSPGGGRPFADATASRGGRSGLGRRCAGGPGARLLGARHLAVPRAVPHRGPHRGARPRPALRSAPAGAPPQGRHRAGARGSQARHRRARRSGAAHRPRDRRRERRGVPRPAGGAPDRPGDGRPAPRGVRRGRRRDRPPAPGRLRRDRRSARALRAPHPRPGHAPAAERARHLAETGYADAYVEAFHTIFGIDISAGQELTTGSGGCRGATGRGWDAPVPADGCAWIAPCRRGAELLEAAAGGERAAAVHPDLAGCRGGGCPVEHALAADGGSGTRG